MAVEVAATVDAWSAELKKLFPGNVEVLGEGESTPAFTAMPGDVSEDPEDGSLYWSLWVSEVHESRVPLAGASVHDDGTLRVKLFGGALVRPSRDKWV